MFIKILAVSTILVACCSGYHLRRYERLPNNTKPISYNLHFVTNVHEDGRVFNGTARIRIQAVDDTNRIVLHASSNFYDIELKLVDLEKDEEINNLKYDYESKEEQLIIRSAPTPLRLAAGKEYLLTISYRTNPCSRPHGFCLYWYKPLEDENKRVPLAATQLDVGSARMVFPCYDEPALKANFTISVTHGNNYMALSNMPSKGELILGDNGYVTTHFLESPPMSTHHVALTVSNYENISEKVGDTDVRLFFKPKSKGGRLALEISKKALVLMNGYFNISFPLPKIDQFSIPGEEDSNGIESWGLIINTDPVLLDDLKRPDKNPKNSKKVITEMAQMWFGNLVTPAWWSETWLSDGISTYYGNKFIGLIKPEWRVEYKVDDVNLWYYAEVCSLTCDAKTEWEYDSAVGKLSSVKGGFFMWMFEQLLTEKVLRKGMIRYLENNQYSSTTEDDLFECLADAMEESLNPYFKEKASLIKALKSWSTQRYYPLVTVSRNYQKGTFTLKQEAYKTIKEGNGKELWWIPITFATSTSRDFENLTVDLIFPGVKQMQINPAELKKPLKLNDWLIVNKEQSGLYRVNYDERNWNLITCALLKDPTIIPESTKTQMIKDLYQLFIEGYVEPPVLFNFLSYLKNESSKKPWFAATYVLITMFKSLKTYEGEPKDKLRQFVDNLLSNASELYSADEKSENFELSDENEFLFKVACNAGLPKCDRVMDAIYRKVKSSGRVSDWENNFIFYGACHIYNHTTKDMKNFIDGLVETQNYCTLRRDFACTKSRDQMKNNLKEALKTNNLLEKVQIASDVMSDPESLEYFIELLDEENDPQLRELFLYHAKSVVINTKSREHKDMLIKAWKKMGHSLNEGHYYGLNKKFEQQDQLKKLTLRWLNTDPQIVNVSCE